MTKQRKEIDYKRHFHTAVKGATPKPKMQPVQEPESSKELFNPDDFKKEGDVFAPRETLRKGVQPDWVKRMYGENKTTA